MRALALLLVLPLAAHPRVASAACPDDSADADDDEDDDDVAVDPADNVRVDVTSARAIDEPDTIDDDDSNWDDNDGCSEGTVST